MPMDRTVFDHAALYCEENVARLLDRAEVSGARTVVFISNAARGVALWNQRAGTDPGAPVLWDYHAVLLTDSDGPQIWDLDSTLAFPCPAPTYLRDAFQGEAPADQQPQFRLLSEALFRLHFASDRSHMRRDDGSWLAPPPPWPCIQAAGKTMTLPALIDMDTAGPGEVLDLAAMRARFAGSG